ncbi:HNH endonuclease [candidate division KSB1 bacterium]|nr:HNH endonuclease [bacterium]OQX60579.1 MAG: HNH endonuclease [candidate division KSB1 bacterium 4484_219]RKY77512.1 MAG: HNH endonuclease [candidate division KSB1 bacterium]HDI52101.1 HNH endonuclease [Bacteroidota bacterium]RKY77953.1 MAG: HNH endonuclease [candidate division KSB1 bacterium]
MLNRHVLILNQNYEPMSVCSAKRAIVLLYLGKAEIVERHEQWVRSVTTALPLPSIVRLGRYIRVPHKRILLTRKNILKRDHYRCQYCGRDDKPLTIDHVIPKERGGQDVWENLVAACTDCNNRKGNRTPEQAGMHLLKKPRKPNYLTFIQHYIGISDDRWKPYLFLS